MIRAISSKELLPQITVIKKLKNSFSQYPTHIYKDDSLKSSELKILLLMMSKPPTWRFNVKVLAKEAKLNTRTVYVKLRNLERSGYIKRYRIREDGGVFGEVVTYVSWERGALPVVGGDSWIVPESGPCVHFSRVKNIPAYIDIEASNMDIIKKDKDLKGGVQIAPPLDPVFNKPFEIEDSISCNSDGAIVPLPPAGYRPPTSDSKTSIPLSKPQGAPLPIASILEASIKAKEASHIQECIAVDHSVLNVSLNEEIKRMERKEVEGAFADTLYQNLNCVIPLSDLYSYAKEYGVVNLVNTVNMMVLRKIWEKSDPLSYFAKALRLGWAKDMAVNKGKFRFKSGFYGQPKDENRIFGSGERNMEAQDPFVVGYKVKPTGDRLGNLDGSKAPINDERYTTDLENIEWWSGLDSTTKKGFLLRAQAKQSFFDVQLSVQDIDPLSEAFYTAPEKRWAFNMLMQLLGRKRERGPIHG